MIAGQFQLPAQNAQRTQSTRPENLHIREPRSVRHKRFSAYIGLAVVRSRQLIVRTEEGISHGEIAKRAADSNDDLVQKVLTDAAARPLLEEGFVDSRELLAKQHAVLTSSPP